MFRWFTKNAVVAWACLITSLASLSHPAFAYDLYFANDHVTVTGGNNYVIDGQTPQSKKYTGTILCQLDTGESLPASILLTVRLYRGSTQVGDDTISYAAGDWLYDKTNNIHYIVLKDGTRDLSYPMPAPGPGSDELATGTYNFSWTLYGSKFEPDKTNNIYTGSDFGYVVYSDFLTYGKQSLTLFDLTPGSSSLCPAGNTWLSSVSGNWSSVWWNDNFADTGICVETRANFNTYSTNIRVIRDVVMALAPVRSGQTWVIKGQMAENITLSNMQVECVGSPPATVDLSTIIRRDTNEIATFAETIQPVWLEDSGSQRYYFTITRSYPLPATGPSIEELQSGSHSITSTISCAADDEISNNSDVDGFTYSVYSGLLYFNEVETHFSDVEFGPSYQCYYVDGELHSRLNSVTGTWDDRFGNLDMQGNALCADSVDNPDGYSLDLTVVGGAVDMGNVDANVAGFDARFSDVQLDNEGGHFTTAVVSMPDDVTVHGKMGTDLIDPRGAGTLTFAGADFSEQLSQVVLHTATATYLHQYGLPFYVSSAGYTLALGGNLISLEPPVGAVYVHQEAEDVLMAVNSSSHPDGRTSFPANDIVFSNPEASGSTVHLESGGLMGSLEFGSNNYQLLHTSFPQAGMTFGSWTLWLAYGRILPGTELDNIQFLMEFGRGCPDGSCGGSRAERRFYLIQADHAGLTAQGAFGAQFDDIGPSYNSQMQNTDEDSVEWGDFPVLPGVDVPGTYERQDRNKHGVFMVPGFIMAGTSDEADSPLRLGQLLLGSHLFDDVDAPGVLLPLHDPDNPAAEKGDGFFAGLNLGPELYEDLEPGEGSLLENQTWLRFYDANQLNDQVSMADRPAVKYVLRPGGLTGVFNTTFGEADGAVPIYGYDLLFSRFAFRMDRNRLDGETFIDGMLALKSGPVAESADGFNHDFEVGFTNLDITCNGNLGSGQVDTEPEPNWPACEGNPDNDSRENEGCQTLMYWNMPVLLTAMGFENDPDTDNSAAICPNGNRKLRLHTRNQIDGFGQFLTMSALYAANGVVGNQELFGQVKTWFDKPGSGDEPGFAIRLRSAYLNKSFSTVPVWPGFMVLAGRTDVPLFDDASLAVHFDNVSAEDRDSYSLSVFQDETDSDADLDGVPDGYGETPPVFRDRLDNNSSAAPKPWFHYSWPGRQGIDLDYFAIYQGPDESTGPQFTGLKKQTDLLGVVSVTSVPDYITPLKTRFSFGVSADLTALQDFQLDLANYIPGGGVDGFLRELLDDSEFSLTQYLCYDPNGAGSGEELCLNSLEENLLSYTGGDLSRVIGQAVDGVLQEPTVTDAVRQMATALSLAHQAPAQIHGLVIAPLQDAKADMLAVFRPSGHFSVVYDRLAAVAYYDSVELRIMLEAQPSPPIDMEELEERLADAELVRNWIKGAVDSLSAGIQAMRQGAEMLTRADGIIVRLDGLVDDGLAALTPLNDAIDSGFAPFLDNDPSLNPLLIEVEKARQAVDDIRNGIEHVQLAELGTALQIDTSLLDDAQQTINSALDEVDAAIRQADEAMTAVYADLPLDTTLNRIKAIIDPDTGSVSVSLGELKGQLSQIWGGLAAVTVNIETQLSDLETLLADLQETIDGSHPLPDSITEWEVAMDKAQEKLDGIATAFRTVQTVSSLQATISGLPADITFVELFDVKLSLLVDASFENALEPSSLGVSLTEMLENMQNNVMASFPQPEEEDIRTMIRSSIVESPAVVELNTAFYEQFGVISDMLETGADRITDKINGIVRQAIYALNEAMATQLAAATDPIGGLEWGLESAGIDGYAIISQSEIERLHLEAEFTFAGEPDSTSYNAALDFTSWKAENGKSGCLADAGEEGTFFDVAISTHDVPAAMLGTDVDIKTAMLGFTINDAPAPIGLFGNCYLDGEINFEVMILEDLGLEAGIGLEETYFGATGAGRFREYTIPLAAFFLGRSCDFGVLNRLDPEVDDFIGIISPLFGVYVRGSVDIPIYNNGCAFTLGVGADMGAWYFTEPSPGTYGGLMGGSAYGRLACLAALKGQVSCLGQKSGSDYTFSGSGWAGAGVGDCSPSRWHSIGNVRNDSWCVTGDASFGATYQGEWVIDGPRVNCCD